MRKQKSSNMRIDDEYTSATKKLIKKTLIGLGISAVIIVLIAVWTFKKITSPKEIAQELPEPSSSEVLAASSGPTPTTSAIPSITPSTLPSASASASLSPSPSPTKPPSSSPTISPSVKSTTTPQPSPTANAAPGKILSSQASLDGFESSNGSGSGTSEIKVGRSSGSITRGFVSFDLSQIQSGTVDKATLRIYQQGTIGSPYSIGGDIKIDQLNYGSTFEGSDYGTSSISSSFATLSNSPDAGWRELDVTQNVKGDLTAGRTRSQFRLHFAVEQTGGGGDYALIESGDNALKTGNIPQLIVQYH